jgi:two-component system KDP operon response regulator KdpE
MKRFCILLVDDEQRILNFLRTKLKLSGYDVITASSGMEALQHIQAQEPDMVVLDILMPEMDGFATLKEIRTFSSVPIIILSARVSYDEKVKGLGLGADDYLAKPFNPDELMARIEAVRRRTLASSNQKTVEQVTMGDVVVDFNKHNISVKGEEVQLTRIEWLLLSELVRNAGTLMLYGDLLTRVWGPEYRDDVQILRTWISRLRNKLEQDSKGPPIIRTISKTGYIIEQPASEKSSN